MIQAWLEDQIVDAGAKMAEALESRSAGETAYDSPTVIDITALDRKHFAAVRDDPSPIRMRHKAVYD